MNSMHCGNYAQESIVEYVQLFLAEALDFSLQF